MINLSFLELLMYILTSMMIGVLWFNKTIAKRYTIILLCMLFVVFLLHLIFDDLRWQFYMFYVVLILSGSMVFSKRIIHVNTNKFLRKTLNVTLIVAIFIFVSSMSIFPMYEIPNPDNDYLIGTRSYIIEDITREEPYSDAYEFRKIKIQTWYPAKTIEGYELAPWLEDGTIVSRALSKDIGLPFFALDHTADIMSNSYIDALLSDTSDIYPVVIISHGWRGFKNLHTDFAEQLASIGYMVVSIDHTYGSVATVFNEDEVAYLNRDALPDRETTSEFLTYANRLVETYAGDVTTTINYLENLNNGLNNSSFANRIDLTKIGLLGHSTGGGGDVFVAINDNRIDAVIGLDAWVEPIKNADIEQGLSIPSLFIRSQTWETGVNNTTLDALIDHSTYMPLLYQIEGTTHYDFTMVYMYSPLTKVIGFSGSINSNYLSSILNSMISDFFDQTLKDDPNSNINPDMWDEVNLIS